MDALRWSLLVIGLLVVAGVYAWSRLRSADGVRARDVVAAWRRRREVAEAPDESVTAQELEGLSAAVREERGGEAAASGEPVAASGEERIVTLHLAAPPGEAFDGAALRSAFDEAGLAHGPMRIFHRYAGESGRETIRFSVASLTEPGWFDAETMPESAYPGLTFFLQLPVAGDPLEAFDDMLATARALAERLDGELKDERRSALTRQTADHLREEIREYRRQSALPARGSTPRRSRR